MTFAEICGQLQEDASTRGSDKCASHNYCEKYDRHLGHLREHSFNLLEIGVKHGFSLKAWKAYFPNANIVGIDINQECRQYEEERISVEIGDQQNASFLQRVEQKHGKFQVIVDDGSHRWKDVITSYKILFPLLENGGIYVIEDLHTSYFKNFSQGGNLSPMEYLKKSIDKINMYGSYTQHFKGGKAKAALKQKTVNEKRLAQKDCDYNIYSIAFYPSIVFIEKENTTSTPENDKIEPKIL